MKSGSLIGLLPGGNAYFVQKCFEKNNEWRRISKTNIILKIF